MSELYIGLMSGTSLDGVGAALVDLANDQAKLIAYHSEPMAADLKQQLLDFITPGDNEIDRMGQLDIIVGKLFARAANNLLQQSGLKKENIIAIGSHGQTIRHRPGLSNPFTLQIGDPNTIAALTGITTVADFRRKDMALGGQGAPLAPTFHNQFMRSEGVNRIVLNLGGIANITLLAKDKIQAVIGFDTGPANGLMDAWIEQEKNLPYDKNGDWAASGEINEILLKNLLADPYFQQAPPKSTGKEYFNLKWLSKAFPHSSTHISQSSVQRTLLELTAQTVIDAIQNFTTIKDGEIIVCGGGAHNQFLLQRLQALDKNFVVKPSSVIGIPPDCLETLAWAWFAKNTLASKPSNLPSVTGANRAAILGGIYYA